MQTIQYQVSTGQWITPDDPERFIEMAIEYAGATDAAAITAELESGKRVRFGTDWCDVLRIKPAPTTLPPIHRHAPCKVCGTTSASRFTTLPDSARTCDDCA